MWGVLLTSVSALFGEIFASISKYEYTNGKESIYTIGFFSLLGGTLLFALLSFFIEGAFYFSLASLPTFIPRVFFVMLHEHFILRALTIADRTTFSFIRVSTIPLLVGIDMILGYTLSAWQLIGIGFIFLALILLLQTHTLGTRGSGFLFIAGINAVITISLYKYNITHFNSVAAEQITVSLILMLYFLVGAYFVAKENPLALLRKPVFFGQALAQGVGSVLDSFAYVFAPASIIVAANRCAAMAWSVVSGRIYFQEGNVLIKLLSMLFLALALILLIPT